MSFTSNFPYFDGKIDQRIVQLRYETSIENRDTNLVRSIYKNSSIKPSINNLEMIRKISRLENNVSGKFTLLLEELLDDSR